MRSLRTAAAAAALALTALAVPVAHAETGVVGPTSPDGRFRDPSTYDVAIAHVTDTQYLSMCANGAGILPSMMARCQAIFDGMNQWIVDNAATRKIAYTVHTGDVIDGYNLRTPNIAKGEFQHASQAMSVLEAGGMPYGVLPGNHDSNAGKDSSIYNTFFGPQRFAGSSVYAGSMTPGDNTNHVDELTVGDVKLAIVYLGYEVSDAEIAWADAQIKARPDTNVIVATHAYLKPGTEPDSEPAALSHDGAKVRALVAQNPNTFLVLSGHEHGVGRNVLTDLGTPGHTVVELMADYQAYSAGWDGLGHAGFVRLLQLDTRHGELTVDTYSPSLHSFRSRDYDTKIGRHYDGTEDEFTVKVNLIKAG